jgi:hypothetical protein
VTPAARRAANPINGPLEQVADAERITRILLCLSFAADAVGVNIFRIEPDRLVQVGDCHHVRKCPIEQDAGAGPRRALEPRDPDINKRVGGFDPETIRGEPKWLWFV